MIGSSLSKTHATKREATAMLAVIVEKIKASPTMSATVQQAGIDPLELYAPIKIGSKWYIKATDKHLKSAKTLQLAHRQRKI